MPQRIELLQIESSIGSNINRYISINFPLFLPVFNIILCYILNIIARNNISSENIFRKNAHFSTDGAFSNRKTVEDILSEYFNSNSKLIIEIRRLTFLHHAVVFMLRRSLVPGRQTNVDAKHAPVINFPRVNVSTRSPGQRLLFVHQFSIHFHSRGSPCDRSGCDASRKRTEKREYPQSPPWLSICGGRVRSYVADLRQTRLPRGSLPCGNIIIPQL